MVPTRITPASLEGDKIYRLSRAILPIFIFFLAACNSSNELLTVSDASEDALSTETQLVLGTLRLDGTEQAVTADQANELLVMWQVYQDLNSSDTAAQEEIHGLVEQIQEMMTIEQMKAISAMNLTQQDVFALMQEQGVSLGQVQQSNNNSVTQNGGGVAPPDGGMVGGPPDAGGGLAGGVPPDGGIGGIGSSGSSTSTSQTQDMEAGLGVGGSAGVPSALVDELIQYLEQIAST